MYEAAQQNKYTNKAIGQSLGSGCPAEDSQTSAADAIQKTLHELNEHICANNNRLIDLGVRAFGTNQVIDGGAKPGNGARPETIGAIPVISILLDELIAAVMRQKEAISIVERFA